MGISGQDGGTGRNASLLCTTKRRITTNLKTKKQSELPENQAAWNSNNQGDKHSSRLVGGVERGSWVEKLHGKVVDHAVRQGLTGQVVPHSHVDKLGETTGE